MTTENVYSPIEDKNIKKDLNNSPVWKNCYKEGEEYPLPIWKYTIKFNGLKPIQVLKVVLIKT